MATAVEDDAAQAGNERSDGFQSGLIGKPWQTNPHPFGTAAYQRWRDGWEDAGGEE